MPAFSVSASPIPARPETLYGQGVGSNYQAQSLKLSKHFKS
jgi:dCTP deaminase